MDSNLYICKGIKLDKSYSNVLNYTTNQMLDLIREKQVFFQDNLNYLDYIEKTIKVDCDYATVIECNYIAFRNPRHGNKWYFAFIDDVKYEAPKQCTISFTVDVWSTFFEDWTQKPCFVVREHVNDDTVGLHTLDEGLGINNYICEGSGSDPDLLIDGYIAIESTLDPSTNEDFQSISIINNNVFGIQLFVVRNNSTGWHNLLCFILACANRGKSDAIKNIYQVPYTVLDENNDLSAITFNVHDGPDSPQGTVYEVLPTFTSRKINSNHYDSTGMQVKNNKCKVYPYRYLLVTNNSGTVNKYKFEFFEKNQNNQFMFEIQSAFSVGGSVRAVPTNYLGFSKNYDESIELGKFPNCGWTSDEYTNWLTQNALNQAVDIIPNMLGAGSQAQNSAYNYQQARASGSSYNTAGSTMNIAGNVAGTVAGIIKTENSAQYLVNKLAGSNMGDVNFASKTLRFEYYNMRMSNEDLKVIDDYFSRFGYKINETKIANMTGRRYWNFIQIGPDETIGNGNIASKYMNDINNICRQGVTIWHSHDNIGNFSLNNTIL